MGMNFDTLADAISHLSKNGWNRIANGLWESSDKTCNARIKTETNHPAVIVLAWAIVDDDE